MMNLDEPKIYAVIHKNEDIRAASRSGGVFTALSDQVIFEGGAIYGCVLTDDFSAVHTRVDNGNDRNKMRGSKYIQSDLGNTFKNVKNDLDVGRKVLFTGTSCQVAGLRSFLGKEYDNLICIDIICHGVPSKKIWKAYLKWQEKRYNSKVVGIDFRNKKDFGWRSHFETLYLKNGLKINSGIFRTLFYSHTILRPSCYECKYKSIVHPGDITIGDYWGIEKAAPEMDDNKGVSLVLVNNIKGERLFNNVKTELICKKTKLQDSMQPPLEAPFPKPENREQFWDDYNTKSFKYIAKKYGGYGVKNRFKDQIIRFKIKIKSLVHKNEERFSNTI